MTAGSDTQGERGRFFGAAKVIAGITLLSRVGGLVRDMILSRVFGATGVTSDFWTAWSIPNFFRRLFGEGALSAAFVPVFSETLETGGRERASALLANVVGLLALLLCGVCVLLELGFLVAHLAAPHLGGGSLLIYAAIMLPFMITICLVALGSAALNCVGHFVYPAAAPILLNLIVIVFAALIAPWASTPPTQQAVVAFALPVTGAVQLAILAWVLRANGLAVLPKLRPLQPGVRSIVTSMGPMMIPLGILQINALLDKIIARTFSGEPGATIALFGRVVDKPLEPGAVTWMSYGERLYQFPMGVLAISLATAVFPLFSRYAARGDTANLRSSVNRALRLAIFEGLPSGVGLLLLGGPLVGLIFGGRNYTAYDVGQTAHVVWFYGLGMWAFCSHHILLRAYYALGDRRTPLRVALSVVGLNFALNLMLIWAPSIRHGAFGLSSSITQSLNVVILAALLGKRLGGGVFDGLAVSVLRMIAATAVMAAGVIGAAAGCGRLGLAGELPVVVAGVAAGLLCYFLAGRLLRAPEIGELLGMRRKVE